MVGQGPNGEKPKPRITWLDVAAGAVDGFDSGYLSTDSSLTERDFGRLRVKQWGKFARKHGLGYIENPTPADYAAHSSLFESLEELRSLGCRFEEASGLLQGSWQGCAIAGYHTNVPVERERVGPTRVIATRLPRSYPDLVWDRNLLGANPGAQALAWYPNRSEYEVFTAPPKPSVKKPGLLARTPVGKAIGEFFEGAPPRFSTTSPEFADRFVAACYRQFDERALKYTWFVRGNWLVFRHGEGDSGMIDHGKRAQFLDAVPLVKRLVDQS